jgi:mono/diheme cytochrome c family protein
MSTYQEERVPFPSPWRLVKELRLRRPPWWLVALLLLVVIGTWIPLTLIYQARQQTSRLPRIHFFHDMDHQPKFGPQAAHPWYVDGRSMRQPIEGTIARGMLEHDQEYLLGYVTLDGTRASSPTRFVAALPERLSADSNLLNRGRERFGIYCAPCHGVEGAGNGPINQAAMALKEGKWVAATNLMTQMIRERADGQLFQAISDGVRSMPSYRSQISVRDRWAIVAYVRELQQTLPVAAEPQALPPTASENSSSTPSTSP